MEHPKLLVIEDDEGIQLSMKWALASDYHLQIAGDRESAIEAFKWLNPPLVTLDLGLPPHAGTVTEGFQTLEDLLALDPFVKIVVITGQDERDNAIRAVGQGAYDFFCKPIKVDEIKIVLNRALNVYTLEKEHRDLQSRVRLDAYEEIIGASPQIQQLFQTIERVAISDVPVLITGESGTGKELVARAIHRRSEMKAGPFVPINCGAIPENLLESELFGHEKGAFTGAHSQRKGRIETAHNGTLFLDEIGELPLDLQVKLLRFLQEHTIDRVGGRKEIQVNARILAATNIDLQQAMRESRFREDLYYRLGVVTISVPPLREREGDIVLLATAFLQRYAEENRKKITGFTPQALKAMKCHAWPGNVRELENRVRRAVTMSRNSKFDEEDLQLKDASQHDKSLRLKDARENLERQMIIRALSRHNRNLTKAAAELGISRPTLYELMERLGIERKSISKE